MAPPQKSAVLKSATPQEGGTFSQEVILKCACDREITLSELGRTYTARDRDVLERFLPHLNETMAAYGITTCLRKAHFLAQVGHETGQLRYFSEQLEKGVQEADVYDGYKGRGLIQITYKAGYVAYGKHVEKDFTGDNRSNLEEPKWATDSAGWYWDVRTSPSLNEYADKNDLIYISQSINGAYNGYMDRLEILGKSTAALQVDHCPRLSSCWNTSKYHLEYSAAYNISAAAFAWGLWHDPASRKHGVVKDEKEALLGYKRFLELKQAQKRGRFGFKKAEDMVAHATDRVDALTQKGSK